MQSPAKFVREVRQEASKVTWPTRKETVATTLTVLVLVIVAMVFFMAVDGIIANLVEWILDIG